MRTHGSAWHFDSVAYASNVQKHVESDLSQDVTGLRLSHMTSTTQQRASSRKDCMATSSNDSTWEVVSTTSLDPLKSRKPKDFQHKRPRTKDFLGIVQACHTFNGVQKCPWLYSDSQQSLWR